MVKVRIGSVEKNLQDADPSWINQEIGRRRKSGEAVCVRVSIDTPSVNMALSTPTCSGVGGGGRAPNSLESRIFALWKERGLNDSDFAGGHLVGFLNRLEDLV